jgi:hypothetical protein
MQQNNLLEISNAFIMEYVENNIPNGRLQSGGREWVAPSPFILNDYKRHFSINTETGLWQCFKTGRQGNFVDIYAFIEEITKRRAYAVLSFKSITEGGAAYPNPSQDEINPVLDCLEINYDMDAYEPLTVDSNVKDPLMYNAFLYLHHRGIFPKEDNEYFICKEGKFADRLIIPYTDEDNEIYYFQARSLKDQKPKYLNPGIDEGVRSQNVLYPFDVTKEVIVTEGPLDAISLIRCGYNATCTNGSNVSDVQALQLKEAPRIIMGYDNDEAGRRGIEKFDITRKRLRMPSFNVVIPPASYKDWNDFLVKNGEDSVCEYLNKKRDSYDSFYKVKSQLGLL